MAAEINGVFDAETRDAILKCRIFMVGAGGIGCELLKNLVLCGFKNIDIIDLDTIDVSNLNRQFLFQKQHVGQSKAAVARESVLRFNPNANITHYHDSVTSPKFNVDFFQQFSVVLNALDNVAARKHVNRLCLAANVPLLDSGTAGYLGQVEVFKGGVTRCYECEVKRDAKSYPGCTIRNTPSEFIHCIVWSKHLFNQLFGEPDIDEEVSPDADDPENVADAGQKALSNHQENGRESEKKTTRAWAEEVKFDTTLLFNKLFRDDIRYLLSMANLWKTRRSPTPLDLNDLPNAVPGTSSQSVDLGLPKDMRELSIREWVDLFKESVVELKSRMADGHLVWDKDDKAAMDFVAASAAIRAHIFGIPYKTRFETKSMAGNIIPAIATTNAVIAGVMVLRTFNILKNKINSCPIVYLRKVPNHKGGLLIPERDLTLRRPNCHICSPEPKVILHCNYEVMTVRELESLMKNVLHMVAPDVVNDQIIVLSSEEGETEGNLDKPLYTFGINDGTVLQVDDFLQNYSLKVVVKKYEAAKDEPPYKLCTEGVDLTPKPETPSTSKNGVGNEEEGNIKDDDDDLVIEDTDDVEMMDVQATRPSDAVKRKKDIDAEGVNPSKRRLCESDIISVE